MRTALLQLRNARKVKLSQALGMRFTAISKFLAQLEKNEEIILVGLEIPEWEKSKEIYIHPDPAMNHWKQDYL